MLLSKVIDGSEVREREVEEWDVVWWNIIFILNCLAKHHYFLLVSDNEAET